jgi:hypothetical protein
MDSISLIGSQIDQLKNALRAGRVQSSKKKIDQVGVEAEFGIVDTFGNPLSLAEQLAKTEQGDVVTEFSKASGELVTPPFEVGIDFFTNLSAHLRSRFTSIQDTLLTLDPNARILRMGLLATRNPSELMFPEKLVSGAKARYLKFVRYLGEVYGDFELLIPTESGSREILQSPPTAGGDTYGAHFNISTSSEFWGLTHDLGIALSWLYPLIGSTSPLAFLGDGAWSSRPFVWSGGMSKFKELTPFGPGNYLGEKGYAALSSWLDFVETRPEILSFDDCGIDPSSPLSAIRLRTGTCWLTAGRLRVGLNSFGNVTSYYELRVPEAAMSIDDLIADLGMFLGLLSYYMDNLDSVSSLISYEDAEKAFWEIAKCGATKIKWEGRVQSSKGIAESLIPKVQKGLNLLGILESDVERITQNVSNRLQNPVSKKIRNLFRSSLANSGDERTAVREVIAGILQTQFQELNS